MSSNTLENVSGTTFIWVAFHSLVYLVLLQMGEFGITFWCQNGITENEALSI